MNIESSSHQHSTSEESMPSRTLIWWRTIRPATLWAGAAPVIVGAGLATESGIVWNGSAWITFVGALVGAILIQIGCNLINDYSDFEKGADNEKRLGPARATAQGWLTPQDLKQAAWLSLGMAGLMGGYLTWVGGWPILALGIASLMAAYAYTAGPFPLAYLGLGDLFVVLFFGLGAVGGTTWLLTQNLTFDMLLVGSAVGALATAILVVNNLRDRHSDAESGKRTLAVRFGATFTRCEYTFLVISAFAIVGILGFYHHQWGWFAPWVLTPLALIRIKQIWNLDATELNPLLGKTAQLELLFCLTLTLGLCYEAYQRGS